MKNIDQIKTLVRRFDRNLDAYRSGHYNETQVRLEFIDPFFKALGWDVHNEAGIAEAYKDVVHEATVKVGGATKAPDYSFRVGGTRKFFVEAKKPSVDIAHDTHPAYQLRRYAWSAKLPLSILTDFEEFAVYDCRVKPLKTDKAATARIMYLTFREYEERWSEITDIFSRDAVWKGDFDRFVESKRKKRGTAEVDSAFLKEIENWRELLARNIALRNPDLTVYDMNFAVQRTIDRIIFLRICEDRSIERYGQLREQLNGDGIYSKLCRLFKRADERFNSGLFHFRKEKDRESTPDTLTLNLAIDDKPLKEIITHLYYPDCPYEFSVLPTEILGHVYEQFLGKVIRLTTAHRAKVEEKPEVRKAGGVYYTPTYIVDYIVKNTVGKLLEDRIVTSSRGAGKTHLSALVPAQAGNNVKEVKPKEVSKLKIVDPACGSGSFLIGAYQYLLDWHRDYYVKKGPGRFKDKIQPVPGGDWRLTTTEKKRILLDNIYGVDIDPQAVEVTKLSLLLKVLEGESEETIDSQLKFFHERALPDLSQNIKCGNSLIGPDFYENEQLSLLDEEERYRINAFDWEAEFPGVFHRGDKKKSVGPSTGSGQGFDVVIGNPPYGFHQIHSKFHKSYFKSHLLSSYGSYEHYFLFYEKSLSLIKKNGLHGFIVPVTWLTIPSAKSLRRYILENTHIEKIVWLPKLVFKNAQVNTMISIIKNDKPNKVKIEIHDSLGFTEKPIITKLVNQKYFIDSDYSINIFIDQKDQSIINKMMKLSKPLSQYANPCSGYNPYEVGKGEKPEGGPHTKETVLSKPYHSNKKHNQLWKPEIIGRDLQRYYKNISGKRWIKYGHWLAAPRDPNNFLGHRILVQEIVGGKQRRIIAAYCETELYNSRDVIPIKLDLTIMNGYLLLGIINSNLITWYHHKKNPKAKKDLFPKVLVSDLKKLPIIKIDLKDTLSKSRHDKMVQLVESILELNKQLAQAKTPHDREVLQRQINATDRQIDRLVYELYELTEEEIHLIEGTADKPRLHKLRRTGRDCGSRNKKVTGKKDNIFP